MFHTNFETLDWVIVSAYLMVALVVGIVVNKYIHNVADYMVGGRGSGAALNVATYIGTGLGLVTLMYASMDAFNFGFAYVTLAVIGAAVGIFLGTTGFVVERLREMDLTTLPEFFVHRYGRKTRITAGVICAAAGILNMGLFPRMGATFITYATGIGAGMEEPETVIKLITTLLVVLVLIYTILGGMVSVIVTDYIQFIVLSIGLGLGVYYCLTAPGLGWDTITTTMVEHRGMRVVNPVAEDSYGWVWIVWMTVVIFGAATAWAPEATRALTSRDARATRLTFLFAGPGQFIRLAIPALLAIAAFTMIANNEQMAAHFFPVDAQAAQEAIAQGEPVKSVVIDGETRYYNVSGDTAAGKSQAAMPLLLGRIVPTGLLGLIVAGLMAAFMSTHDSYLLAWASIITRDVVAPLRAVELTDREQITITRFAVLAIGVALIVVGLWMPPQKSIWAFMALTGTIYISGAATATIGGMYWRRASSTGAVATLCTGLLAGVAIVPNFEFLDNRLPDWFTTPNVCMGVIVACPIVFIIVSLLCPDRREVQA